MGELWPGCGQTGLSRSIANKQMAPETWFVQRKLTQVAAFVTVESGQRAKKEPVLGHVSSSSEVWIVNSATDKSALAGDKS